MKIDIISRTLYTLFVYYQLHFDFLGSLHSPFVVLQERRTSSLDAFAPYVRGFHWAFGTSSRFQVTGRLLRA